MTTWVLLLRAVNLGPRNKLAMADLRALLTDLGHTDVRTVLNSGNAVFRSSRRSRSALTAEVEKGLRERHGLDVRATLRTTAELQAALDALPPALADAAYVVVSFLFDRPPAAALRQLPPHMVAGDGVVYVGFAERADAAGPTGADLEKLLGVAATARTPATVRKLLA